MRNVRITFVFIFERVLYIYPSAKGEAVNTAPKRTGPESNGEEVCRSRGQLPDSLSLGRRWTRAQDGRRPKAEGGQTKSFVLFVKMRREKRVLCVLRRRRRRTPPPKRQQEEGEEEMCATASGAANHITDFTCTRLALRTCLALLSSRPSPTAPTGRGPPAHC